MTGGFAGGEFVTHPDWGAAGGWTDVARTDDPNDDLFGHAVADVSTADADAATAVLVGEPFDGAVIGRAGAADGPTAIRRSLARTKTHHFDAGDVARIGDLGDVATLVDAETDTTEPADEPVESVQRRLQGVTAAVYDLEALPVFLGGDNSLTYANVAPLLESHESVGVVNLDAHLDVRELRGEATSGTPYRQLFEAGLEGYVCLGARHFETAGPYHEFVRERGGEIVTAEEVGDDPVAAATLALEALSVDTLYVSVDCDVLDASAAPGVSAPTPGGLSTRELFRLLRVLAGDDRVAGFEVVECAPPLDRDGLTVDAAARAVAHFLAGYGVGRR
ncbi:formimidoylglutamase [Natrononativus amylolyticus]|uniref:formimidoylglutamase n=1 Tax=Natrononativus amylolyticus TaxID=2963434 RepID=UPI0020CBABE9|nr:formimidoylglutamase [Natrononativus amylolyticus]